MQKSILMLFPVVLVLTAAGIAAADDRVVDDSSISARVQQKIESDGRFEGPKIRVETRDGEVTLKGTVASQADVRRAAELAGYVDGVKRVDNRLKTVKSYTSSSRYGGMTVPMGCQIGANWEC